MLEGLLDLLQESREEFLAALLELYLVDFDELID